MFLLLLGYRGTGKDTFFKELQKCKSITNAASVLNYKCTFGFANWIDIDKNKNVTYKRIGLADSLKEHVYKKYNFPQYQRSSIGSLKDKPIHSFLCGNVETKNFAKNTTFRDLCIQEGTQKCKEQPTYWCEQAMQQQHPISNEAMYVVTDLRQWHELFYFQKLAKQYQFSLKTIRLVRTQVAVPPINIPTEHELDSFQSDIVLENNSG